MKRWGLSAASAGLWVAIGACSSSPNGSSPETQFESAGNASNTGRNDEDSPSAGADSGTASDEGGSSGRQVVEADIYRFEGDRLYVLNQFRGLFVFDVSDKSHPVEIGRMPLQGFPVEMYVREGRAYAILTDYFDWAYEADGDTIAPHYGSKIVGIDLTDPTNPVEIGSTFLDGYVSDTRLVGDVIYAAANRYAWYYYGASEDSRSLLEITSIDISNPSTMREVQQLTLEGNGWYVQASPNAFVVAGSQWSEGERTELVYIDISSPTGEMAKRADLIVDGYIDDDTAINLHENQLRLLTRSREEQTTKLRIFDTSAPDELPLLGSLDYTYMGDVYGTTFDGDRLYMIHYQTIDPLEVVDLSDPTAPFIAGILEMPGWVDRIAALGDRLIGLGYNDTTGRQVSLTLFDVSNAAEPRLLDRIDSGEGWAWTSATWERKAWTVDAESGVVLFPYTSYGTHYDDVHFALGIVDFTRDDLSPRGEVVAAAPVERGAIRDGRVFALSQAALQVVDIRDRAAPTATATIELARNVMGYARTASIGVELVSPGLGWYYWYGSTDFAPVLRATNLDAPDSETEVSRIELPRAATSVFAYGNYAVAVLTNNYGYRYGVEDGASGGGDSDTSGVIRTPGVTVISFEDPSNPEIVADFDLPSTTETSTDGESSYAYWNTGYGRAYGSWQGGTPALELGGGRFAFQRIGSTSCWSREACARLGIDPTISHYDDEVGTVYEYVNGYRTDNAVVVLDLSGSSPSLGDLIELPTGSLEQVFAQNGGLFFTRAEPSRTDEDGHTYVRNFFYRYAVEEDGSLTDAGRVNIPGVAIALSEDGRELMAIDMRWEERREGDYAWTTFRYNLASAHIDGARATLGSTLDLGFDPPNLTTIGDAIYLVRNNYGGYAVAESDGVGVSSSGLDTPIPSRLITIDASDIDDLHTAALTNLGVGAYWNLFASSESTLALQGGYYQSGLALIDIERDPLHPTFRRFQATKQGWSSSIAQDGSTVYLVNGPYGIEAVNIDE